MWYHQQRLSKGHVRGWLHLDRHGHKAVSWELSLWSKRFGIGLNQDDENLTFDLSVFLFSLYLSVPPIRRLRNFESQLSIHDWAIWFTPFGRLWEWNSRDPWWRRGLTFHIDDFFLGRIKTDKRTIRDEIPVTIPMPEGTYRGKAKVEEYTHKRRRWLARKRLSTWIEVPKGIPHSGKGENSWDCGDDGIWACGVEGDDLDKAVAHYQELVMKNREKYGNASDLAVSEALAACA